MIDNLILSCLNENSKVTIPSLGTLISKNGSVIFLPFLKSNDGALSQYIMGHIPVSKDEANEIINTFAQEIMQTIDIEGEYLFGECGTLKKDINKLIYLEQNNNHIQFLNSSNSYDVEYDVIEAAPSEKASKKQMRDTADADDSNQIPPNYTSIFKHFDKDGDYKTPTSAKETVLNELITKEIERKESAQRQMIADEIGRAIAVNLNDRRQGRASVNELAAINRQKTLAESITNNRTFADFAQNEINNYPTTNAYGNAMQEPQNVAQPPQANPYMQEPYGGAQYQQQNQYSNVMQEHQGATAQPPAQGNLHGNNVQDPRFERAQFQAGIDNRANQIYEYTSDNDGHELLSRLQESRNKKSKLYDLYETPENSQNTGYNLIHIDPINNQPIHGQEQKYRQSGPDGVIIISVIAIILAVVVSIYHFMVRAA